MEIDSKDLKNELILIYNYAYAIYVVKYQNNVYLQKNVNICFVFSV